MKIRKRKKEMIKNILHKLKHHIPFTLKIFSKKEGFLRALSNLKICKEKFKKGGMIK